MRSDRWTNKGVNMTSEDLLARSLKRGSLNDRRLLNRAWHLIEGQTERSVDGVGLLPWRPHDFWSALSTVSPDFASYHRLNDQMAESAHLLFGTVGLAEVANLSDHRLRHVFQHAMAADDKR